VDVVEGVVGVVEVGGDVDVVGVIEVVEEVVKRVVGVDVEVFGVDVVTVVRRVTARHDILESH
jgi:hypothetical protein